LPYKNVKTDQMSTPTVESKYRYAKERSRYTFTRFYIPLGMLISSLLYKNKKRCDVIADLGD